MSILVAIFSITIKYCCSGISSVGNISIFWEYRDISLDNILYHGHPLISKYCIPILILLSLCMLKMNVMAVYILDMTTRVIL